MKNETILKKDLMKELDDSFLQNMKYVCNEGMASFDALACCFELSLLARTFELISYEDQETIHNQICDLRIKLYSEPGEEQTRYEF